MPLVQIAGADAGLDRNVQALMTLMVEQDQVQDLIAAARAARPRNPELRAGEQNLAMTFQPFADVQNTPPAMMENIQKVGVENVIVESARFPEARPSSVGWALPNIACTSSVVDSKVKKRSTEQDFSLPTT